MEKTIQNNLQTPYQQLVMSKGLKRFFSANKISNIEILIQSSMSDIYKMNWMSPVLYSELIILLKSNGVKIE